MSSLQRKYSFIQSIFYRHGAAVARGAHNSEGTRSKRVVGIIIKSHRCIEALEHSSRTTKTYRCSSAAERLQTPFVPSSTITVCFTDGYRLISGRSQDRNLSPVIFQFGRFTETTRHSSRDEKRSTTTFTGMAQRQRAWLITPRSLDRNQLPVLFHFGRFTEATQHNPYSSAGRAS